MSYVIRATDPDEGYLYWIEGFGWGGVDDLHPDSTAMVFEEKQTNLPIFDNGGVERQVECIERYLTRFESNGEMTYL